jgi:hypothetical protein
MTLAEKIILGIAATALLFAAWYHGLPVLFPRG